MKKRKKEKKKEVKDFACGTHLFAKGKKIK